MPQIYLVHSQKTFRPCFRQRAVLAERSEDKSHVWKHYFFVWNDLSNKYIMKVFSVNLVCKLDLNSVFNSFIQILFIDDINKILNIQQS